MKILLTAFEPFGGEAINAAALAAELVPEEIDGAAVTRLTVPTAFGPAEQAVFSALAEEEYDVVLCLGQATGRAELTPERVAINLDDARIPDNLGLQPREAPIVPGGPAGRFATLPVSRMAEAIRQAGLPARVSNTAGTFVCNHLMYQVLAYVGARCPQTRAGFLHVPCTPAQAAASPAPSLSPADTARGITAALQAALRDAEEGAR